MMHRPRLRGEKQHQIFGAPRDILFSSRHSFLRSLGAVRKRELFLEFARHFMAFRREPRKASLCFYRSTLSLLSCARFAAILVGIESRGCVGFTRGASCFKGVQLFLNGFVGLVVWVVGNSVFITCFK